MNKITYKTSNIFSLKKYNDNNLNCQSYEYPTIYGLRCAIIGAMIQVDGIEKAKELFNKVKNSNIYIQYPKDFKVNNIKQKRISNGYYKKYDELEYKNINKSTMGFRQYIKMDSIVFYIDSLIPDIEIYLKNIDWLGTAESMVYLSSIENVNTMKDVLVRWDKQSHINIFEQHDWNSKTTFESVYMYSSKYKHIHDTFMCSVKDIVLPSEL